MHLSQLSRTKLSVLYRFDLIRTMRRQKTIFDWFDFFPPQLQYQDKLAYYTSSGQRAHSKSTGLKEFHFDSNKF